MFFFFTEIEIVYHDWPYASNSNRNQLRSLKNTRKLQNSKVVHKFYSCYKSKSIDNVLILYKTIYRKKIIIHKTNTIVLNRYSCLLYIFYTYLAHSCKMAWLIEVMLSLSLGISFLCHSRNPFSNINKVKKYGQAWINRGYINDDFH